MKTFITLCALFFAGPVHAACGLASYYGIESGPRTASGERFKPGGLTAAHRTLPFGTELLVCRQDLVACVAVRVNDRGPVASTGRDLDLSVGAARKLKMLKAGVVRACWNENEFYLFIELLGRAVK